MGKFWAPVPWMLEVTVILELALGRQGEAVVIGALLLFNAILARYLAFVATDLPGTTPEDEQARATARDLVLTSATSAWDYRQTVDGLPLFGAFWDRNAVVPQSVTGDAQFVEGAVNASEVPERDLSVQLSGWMLMEAAHTLDTGQSDGDADQ